MLVDSSTFIAIALTMRAFRCELGVEIDSWENDVNMIPQVGRNGVGITSY